MFLYGLAQSVSCECFEYFFTPPLVVCGVESINLYILLAQTRMWLLWRLITIITHYGHVITLKTSHWRICQTHHNLRRSRRKQRRSLYWAKFTVQTNKLCTFEFQNLHNQKWWQKSSLLAPVINQVVRKRGGTPLKRGLEQVCAGSRLKQTWKYTFPWMSKLCKSIEKQNTKTNN